LNKKPTILIFGPLPPPAGGISIHIWRLKYLLEQEFTVDFIDEASTRKKEYYNVKSFNPFPYLQKIGKADILYIQTGSRILKKLHILTGKLMGKKMIITLHGYGPRRKMPFRAIDSFFFRMADKIILVNPDIFNRLSLPTEKCIYKHAFLPPVMQEEAALPAHVSDWMNNTRRSGASILCANASRLDIFQGQELYGLDMCIDVTKRLLEKRIPVGFIYTVSSTEHCADRFEQYQQQIKSLGLSEHFLLLHEKVSFVKVIERSDVVVRPTNTDGDALTIREAIYLGKPILASDVVERPEGTTLFKTRDLDDLEAKLVELIKEKQSGKAIGVTGPAANQTDFKQFYSNLIHDVLNRKAYNVSGKALA
jgi:glycosyltransferase involved in cell wall biosynthesis